VEQSGADDGDAADHPREHMSDSGTAGHKREQRMGPLTDGLHSATPVVAVVGFGVAVIKAAPAVEVLAAHHGVDRLGVVARRNARRLVDVVPKP
jgi:hypothetical protein